MKKITYLNFAIYFALSTVTSPLLAASSATNISPKGTSPQVAAQAEPTKVEITPQYLRTRLQESNIGVLKGLNQVYQAKLDVNLKRAQLLPSINLGAALNSQSGNFFVSAVSFLMPFLIPSNWFNYKESKFIFDAEKHSYFLMKLNLYASAFSTITTINADLALKNVLEEQYKSLLKIQEMIQLRYDFGLVSDSDLTRAQAQTQLAAVQLSQVEQLIVKEMASLRLLLALPLSTEIQLSSLQIAESDIEEIPTQLALEKSLEKSPEYAQILNLISASKESKWSKAFAYMNSSALTAVGSENQPVAFNNMTASGQLNFSFGFFPALQMTNAATQQLELRKREIQLEQARLVESNLGTVAMVKSQLANATQAEVLLKKILQEQILNYSLGLTDLLHILDTQNSITQASTARVQNQNQLDQLRINLHRLMLTDEFAKIEPCKAKLQNASIWKEIKDFFISTESQKKIEQLCQGNTKVGSTKK